MTTKSKDFKCSIDRLEFQLFFSSMEAIEHTQTIHYQSACNLDLAHSNHTHYCGLCYQMNAFLLSMVPFEHVIEMPRHRNVPNLPRNKQVETNPNLSLEANKSKLIDFEHFNLKNANSTFEIDKFI